MKKNTKNLGIVLVLIIVLVIVFLARSNKERELRVQQATPGPAMVPTKPVKLDPVIFETIEMDDPVVEVAETGEQPEEEAVESAPVSRTVPAVRLSPFQVLALVNGRPLTTAHLMPARKFRKAGTATLPAAVLDEVLDQAIQRELIFQEAETQGLALNERQQAQLDSTFKHLTGNPLNLPEGQTVIDTGSEEDAAFYVQVKQARLLQIEVLNQMGQPDTAEARLALQSSLKEAANIETVNLEPASE